MTLSFSILIQTIQIMILHYIYVLIDIFYSSSYNIKTFLSTMGTLIFTNLVLGIVQPGTMLNPRPSTTNHSNHHHYNHHHPPPGNLRTILIWRITKLNWTFLPYSQQGLTFWEVGVNDISDQPTNTIFYETAKSKPSPFPSWRLWTYA